MTDPKTAGDEGDATAPRDWMGAHWEEVTGDAFEFRSDPPPANAPEGGAP